MTREQFLLIKLTEECAEVAQRALKQIQFGANQIQKGDEVKGGVAAPEGEVGLTNAQRLNKEILDLGIILDLLSDADVIPVFVSEEEFQVAKKRKIEKMNKYLAFARSLGELSGDWTV